MRLHPFLLLAASLCPLSVQSQANFLYLGGGLNLSTFVLDLPSGAEPPDQSFRSGFGVSGGLQTQPAPNVAVNIGLGYETRGAVWTIGGEEGTVKFNYFHVPLAIKLIGANPGPRPYFAPGVDLAFLTSSEIEVGSQSEDIENVANMDLDLGAALGVEIPAGRNFVFLEAGYAYGLLDTNDESSQAAANNSNIKLRGGILFAM